MTQTEAKRKLLMDQLQEWRRVHIKLEDRSQELDRSEESQFEAQRKKFSCHQCVLCGEKMKIEEGEENSSNFSLKLHYTSHYLEQRPEMFLGLVSSTYGGQHSKNFRCPYMQCTPRAMFLKELNLHLSTSHELLRTCLKEDKRPGMSGVCSLLYPEVQEEESHTTVTVKQERLDPEPELEMENDKETLDDPDDDTLHETVSNISAKNQPIKLNSSFSHDPYSLGIKVSREQNKKIVSNPPDKFVFHSQSRIVQNTNKDKDTSSPVGTNSRVMGGNLSSQKLTNRNEQIEVVEKKFDPNYK